MRKRVTIFCLLKIFLCLSACGKEAEVPKVQVQEQKTEKPAAVSVIEVRGISAPAITLTSDNLHDGVWDQVISNTDSGQNKSPQLSWDPVEGATEYAIYMSDINMQDFIHWKSGHITETTLPEGFADEPDYIGPYPPPGGTHTYEIYLLALKEPVERLKGGVNSANPKFEKNIQSLDETADGQGGNILAIGYLSGTYTNP